ncbi:GNAT family N-acetyltransferase [Loktanella agnita]|uniref:GNAT family N-acetyltransferase n=1 Tax=Loktanella agnita TaxID=287097 RepID=UPI0039876547
MAWLWHDAWHEAHALHVPSALTALRNIPSFLRRVVDAGDQARTIGADGNPLGFCAITGRQMEQLFVASAARGSGVAAALLKDAEQRLYATGVVSAYLHCLPQNTTAIRFYEKMGWVGTDLHPVELTTSAGPFVLDCIVFTKSLS